ncbi:unnamed protein product [Dimorphilus gyrociliatus]|uniref:UBC core domain-containing protein n=1 Tax=Dimorphilus gyrociliatus TaxID=2664684 RepID=A0A7I8VHL9_9ANNE|nr:unnamed protein product [Dimorphilus gyrociliatus]
MAAEGDRELFAEDEISSLTETGEKKYGLVLETAETGHDDIYIEESEMRLALGMNRIAWFPTGVTSVVSSEELTLEDRSILPSDIVRRMNDPGGVKGYATSTKILCNLEEINGFRKFSKVDTSQLIPIFFSDIDINEPVAMDCWAGVIEDIDQEITLAFSDGAMCKVCLSDETLERFKDTSDKTVAGGYKFADVLYYVSQTLTGCLCDLMHAKWTRETKYHNSKSVRNADRKKTCKVTIINIRVKEVEVEWDACAITGKKNKRPKRIIRGPSLRKLKKLDCFNASTYQLGDIVYFSSHPPNVDNPEKIRSPYDKFVKLVKDKNWSRYAMPEFENLAPYVITYTESHVGVMWQDGTTEKDINSCQLYPINYPDDNEYFPGDYVYSREGKSSKQYAVVKRADHLGRTCFVRWFQTISDSQQPEVIKDEEVSVYELREHDTFTFRPGTVVVRSKKYTDSPSDNDTYSENVGQVLEMLTDGRMKITWYGNTESLVYPTEVIVKYDSDDDDDDDDDDGELDFDSESENSDDDCEKLNNSNSSWETEEEDSEEIKVWEGKSINLCLTLSIAFEHLQEAKKTAEDVCELINSLGKGNELPDDALEEILENVIYKVAPLLINSTGKKEVELTKILKKINKHQLSGEKMVRILKDISDTFQQNVINAESEVEISSTGFCSEVVEIKEEKVEPEVPEVLEENGVIVIDDSDDEGISYEFDDEKIKFVEIVPDDHYFKRHNPGTNPRFIKHYHSEMQKLSKDLPKGIRLIAYESDTHKLRVLIQGTHDTPYEDGVFFFDIYLPETYPLVPPEVYYHSMYAERLNPNLYVDGKVCLSLLGTWSGKGTEKWTPKSTLLQLLISIQSLILVEEPYFNEAGYELQRNTANGMENSRMYNEMVLLTLTKSLSVLSRKIPAGFEEEVQRHIKETGGKFLKRIESWIEKPDEPRKPSFPLLPLSRGFQLAFNKAKKELEESIEPNMNS